MRIRRCTVLWLEHRDTPVFDLEELLAGGTGVSSDLAWCAHAPQLDASVQVDLDDIRLLGALSPHQWASRRGFDEEHGIQRVRKLLKAGLVIGSTQPWAGQRGADDRLRETGWFGVAALLHNASRWRGVDSPGQTTSLGVETAEGLRLKHGLPPAAIHSRGTAVARTRLPPPANDAFDDLLDARATCRNFDTGAVLPLDVVSRVLARAFGARGQARVADDFDLIKRSSPSGGSMHPTECYVIVQRVHGLSPGLYHYNVGAHALDALPIPDDLDMSSFGHTAVAGQQWFAEAPVLCVLAPRFFRNYWKYRNHAKAYRVCILDIGHLSQTLQLCATQEGLGSFITAAINEVDIEAALGLTGLVDGPMAVCGFGARADAMATPEFDPNRKVWPG